VPVVLPRPLGFQTDLVYTRTHPDTDTPYTITQDLVFDDGVIRIVVPACALGAALDDPAIEARVRGGTARLHVPRRL
jgi:hypothetical protein